jgi:hypothetical protein
MASARAIVKLRRELQRIQDIVLPVSGGDNDDETLFLLKQARDHIVRAGIIETQLAIEDLLTKAIANKLLSGKSDRTVFRKALEDIRLRFPQTLMLARTLGLITQRELKDLEKLNTVRNSCAHRWQLGVLVSRGVPPKEPKRPILKYQGKNVYNIDVLKSFIEHFRVRYLKLYMRLDV